MYKNVMRKVLIIVLFLFFFSSLAPIAMSDLILSIPDNVTDSNEDIFEINISAQSWKTTDLHSELDIRSMVRANQDFTITFNGTIQTGSNYLYQFGIFEEVDDVDSYKVLFSTGYDGELFGPEGYWNGTGWDLYSFSAVSVGNISANTIEITIPAGALTIQSSHNWAFIAMFTDTSAQLTYADICPDEYRSELLSGYSGPSSAIIGYELAILIGCIFGFTIIFIYNHKRKGKSGF